jgi:sec-independent protein translocase protein TatC
MPPLLRIAPTQNNPKAEMPFLEHVAELRVRLLRSVLVICVGAVVAYFFVGEIFDFITAPLRSYFVGGELIGTGPSEAFISKFKVAIAGGFLLTMPWTMLEFWMFIAPALKDKERQGLLPMVAVSSMLFIAGIVFSYQLVMPVALGFFSSEYLDIGVKPSIRIGEYIDFIVKMTIVFGVVFQLPVGSFLLARLGIITDRTLKRHFRHAVLVIFISAAFLTPTPDIINQLMLAGPMLVLYGVSILVAKFASRGPEKSSQT